MPTTGHATAGIVGAVVRPDPITRTTVLGMICLTFMVSLYGFQLTRRGRPQARPWRDQGRLALWFLGLLCLLGALSFWLSAIYG